MRGGRPHNCKFFAHLYHKLLPPPPVCCILIQSRRNQSMSADNWVNIVVINNMMRHHFRGEIFWKRLVVIIWDKYLWQHISHFWWHSFTSTPCVEIRKYLSVICKLRVDIHRDKWTPFAEALAFVNLGRHNLHAANFTRSTITSFLNALIVNCRKLVYQI